MNSDEVNDILFYSFARHLKSFCHFWLEQHNVWILNRDKKHISALCDLHPQVYIHAAGYWVFAMLRDDAVPIADLEELDLCF